MRALVTGGTGYLGSVLVRQWLSRHGKESVVCMVPAFGTPAEVATRESLEGEGVLCVEGDLCRFPVANDLAGPWDVIFHFAAATDTSWPESRLAPVNVEGTNNLLKTLSGHLRGTRVLMTSTSAAVDRRKRPGGRPLTESSPCQPRTGYGRTKLAAENIIKESCSKEGATYTIARLTTLYGPKVRTGLVPVLADGLRQGKTVALIDWPGRTSMLFVDDAVDQLLFLAESPAAANETFFLTSGEAIRIGDLAQRIAQEIGGRKKMIRLPRWFWAVVRTVVWLPGVTALVPWRLLHILDDGLWCDNSKMNRLYPRQLVQLPEGLARTFEIPEPSQSVPA
jgi:UDP-glucose 4-epimerase